MYEVILYWNIKDAIIKICCIILLKKGNNKDPHEMIIIHMPTVQCRVLSFRKARDNVHEKIVAF